MPRNTAEMYRNAVLLRDDSMGVATETTPRRLQERPNQTGFRCSLNVEWLDQLGMAQHKEPTVHSVSMGVKPVLVQNRAIIIQPKDVLESEDP